MVAFNGSGPRACGGYRPGAGFEPLAGSPMTFLPGDTYPMASHRCLPNAPGYTRHTAACGGCMFYAGGPVDGECRKDPTPLFKMALDWCGQFSPLVDSTIPQPKPLPAWQRLWHRAMLFLDPFPPIIRPK